MSARPPLEVADVFREHAAAYLADSSRRVTVQQRRVLAAVANCRTAALGGHVERCDACDHVRIAYNSCRNRHCPKCQASARAEWLDQRSAELLPIPYFHVVFTLPAAFAPLAQRNPRTLYGLLFRAAAETLLEIAADARHLGAEIGVLAVLHTWGQNLALHPHLHCIVTGGGFSADGQRWVSSRKTFFLPVRILSRVFRGKFLHLLRRSCAAGELAHGETDDPPAGAAGLEALIRSTLKTDWVVYAKPPFGGPEQVLKYLARYTHRVAISNQRLLALHGGRVTFRWKDYADGQAQKAMSLTATEFIRRFLLHVLPRGFVKIRYYGFLANRCRQPKLAAARRLLNVDKPATAPMPAIPATGANESVAPERPLCPICRRGRMIVLEELRPTPAWTQPLAFHRDESSRRALLPPINSS